MARDIITEIEDLRSRNPDGCNRLSVFTQRINDLRFLAREWLHEEWACDDERCRIEALRYIPIALVASIEGWLRFAVRDLIDVGEPFTRNSKALPNLKFDHDLVMALATQKLTAGEIVARFVSCNRMQDVLNTLETITATKFPPLMEEKDLGRDGSSYPVKEVYDLAASIVTDTFKLRHIFAHELAPNEKVDSSTIVRRVGACQVFVTAADLVVTDILNGVGAGS